MALNLMTDVLVRRENRDTEGKAVQRWQGLELCCHQPRNIKGHQKLDEARKDSSLEPSERT